MAQLTPSQIQTLKLISAQLNNTQYAIRGTSSLVLQGLDMNVDDIDIICDKATALKANDLFKEYIVDPVTYKESPRFKSYFGKFKINDVDVEVMGDWQIKDKKGEWSKPFDGSSFTEVTNDGVKIRVTKVEEELKMFILMQRFTAYQKIRLQLKRQLEVPKNPAMQTTQKGLFN